MTGLNLESFLHLLRADLGTWATLGLIALVLGLMAWTSWGSRRALRKCLVLSIIAHCGLALYGGSVPVLLLALKADDGTNRDVERIRSIKVSPWTDPSGAATEPSGHGPRSADGRHGSGGGLAPWDRLSNGLALADSKLNAPKTERPRSELLSRTEPATIETAAAAPEVTAPSPPVPENRPDATARDETAPPAAIPSGTDDVAPAVVGPKVATGTVVTDLRDVRLRPERTRAAGNAGAGSDPAPRSPLAVPDPVAPIQPSAAEAPALAMRTPGGPGAEAVAATPSPRPTAAADGDVARPDVIAASPDATRLSVGDASLRGRARPAGTPGTVRTTNTPANRSVPPTLALSPPLAGPLTGDLTGSAPGRLAERPISRGTGDQGRPGDGVGGGPAGRGDASGAGPAAVAAPGEELRSLEVVKTPVQPLPPVVSPESDVRRRTRTERDMVAGATGGDRRPVPGGEAPLSLARVVPSGVPALPEIQGASGGRPLADVPEVYRSRLDPNRSALAYRAGASPASEQAVERALNWLARHQDDDGRWDAATAKYDDGTAVQGDDDFTVHCPPGETCFGECVYWEADTALTGLALLSYLGAGYTQTDGKYAETVGKGLDYLRSVQKPDGDLRGKSRAVGMYCHAMATIALCEAYALTGDERLRGPVERAVDFLVHGRARDGLAWRYAPGAPVGDTSILGWVVMALKSAREVGIQVPSTLQSGTLGWLAKVASGEARGLARYQPSDSISPTMTAEAWVCRQFLAVGGPGPASTEAADYLLAHGPKRDQYNLYYWYYGTLAMYQHGGPSWARWNGEVRDEIVRRQRVGGHIAGSWDPDDSPYGSKGGRIYCTALATLSLEVYYRYLRLYDEPSIPPAIAPSRTRTLGRLGNDRQPVLPDSKPSPRR
jgi:hypothetical protein